MYHCISTVAKLNKVLVRVSPVMVIVLVVMWLALLFACDEEVNLSSLLGLQGTHKAVLIWSIIV